MFRLYSDSHITGVSLDRVFDVYVQTWITH